MLASYPCTLLLTFGSTQWCSGRMLPQLGWGCPELLWLGLASCEGAGKGQSWDGEGWEAEQPSR